MTTAGGVTPPTRSHLSHSEPQCVDHERHDPHQPSVLVRFQASQLTVPVGFTDKKPPFHLDTVSWYLVVFYLAPPGHT